ncbi:MAG: ABC transporter ATP-binding protein [Halobacteriaceae archaeon]
MDAAIVASGVRKRYGDVVALDGVDLQVAGGETFALIGPNGAGKTTLVRCLTGTADPGGGEARLLGADPAAVDAERVGVLPQAYGPPGRLTAREIVAYYAGLYDDPREVDAVLAELGLAGVEGRYEDLSGGQRRRVCVAAAVVNDPEVLFLDEPTTAIDPEGRRSLWELLDDLGDAGTTIFLTTHDMAEAERLADRVGLLAGGRVVATGTPADLVAAHGGASELRVATDADPAALADARFEAVREDGDLVVSCGATEVAAVVRALDAAGVDFEALEWHEPGLEDVYLELADEGAAEGVAP